MSLRPVILDADAFLALRSLGLLAPLVRGLAAHTRVVVTGYVGRRELSTVAAVVTALSNDGVLAVEALEKRSPAQQTFQKFKRAIAQHDKAMKRVDLGEAECVACALHVEPTPVFVSCDVGARSFADRHRVRATDVLGLGVVAVHLGALSEADLRERLAPWDSPDPFVCRPKGYTTFDEFFTVRWPEESILIDA